MAKKSKLATPDWIREGYGSPAEYAKAKGVKTKNKEGKTFKVRVCPECRSDNVGVVLVGEEGKKADKWECRKCKWIGRDIEEKELSEDGFMKYLDEKWEGKA
jgi:hypothetical protein